MIAERAEIRGDRFPMRERFLRSARFLAHLAKESHEPAETDQTFARARNQIADRADAPQHFRVIALAGLPGPVVERARRLLAQLERKRPRPEATQLSLFGGLAAVVVAVAPAPLVDPVRVAVRALEPDAMSPREAQDALYRLKRLASEA